MKMQKQNQLFDFKLGQIDFAQYCWLISICFLCVSTRPYRTISAETCSTKMKFSFIRWAKTFFESFFHQKQINHKQNLQFFKTSMMIIFWQCCCVQWGWRIKVSLKFLKQDAIWLQHWQYSQFSYSMLIPASRCASVPPVLLSKIRCWAREAFNIKILIV